MENNYSNNSLSKLCNQIRSAGQAVETLLANTPGSKDEWPFNVKMYDLASYLSDNDKYSDFPDEELDILFYNYCDSLFDIWRNDIEEMTNLDYFQVFTCDNHHGDYFKFTDEFLAPFDVILPLVQSQTCDEYNLLTELYNSGWISYCVEDDFDDNEQLLQALQNPTEQLQFAVDELKDFLSSMDITYNLITKVIHFYTNLKNNQVEDFKAQQENQ